MKGYHVVWEIDIDADSPLEAVKAAQDMQRNHESGATVFDVWEHDAEDGVRIDLLDELEQPMNRADGDVS